MNRLASAVVCGLVCLSTVVADAKAPRVKVCVDVDIREHQPENPPVEPAAEKRRKERQLIYPFPPRSYLKRMLEHYVTHERGFVAAKDGCTQRLTVELYPLNRGWTAFARYTGFQQEEKINRVFYAEFPRLAKRMVLALLYNKRVEQTIDRLSVLKADSIQNIETVKGTNHIIAAVGSGFRFPIMGLPSAVDAKPDASAETQFRLLTPVNLQLGYRGSFTSWCIDAYARLGLGVGQKAQRTNTLGGHINHEIDFGLGLSILWYLDPSGFNTFYAGTGASFDLSWYSVVEPVDRTDYRKNSRLYGAGLAVNAVFGYEFLRTSEVRPFAQVELNLPAYIINTENDLSAINAWIPGVTVMAGVMF